MQEELGVKIVKAEVFILTPQGEYLVQCADDILAQLNNIKEHVQNMSMTSCNEVAGTLKLGVSNFFCKL